MKTRLGIPVALLSLLLATGTAGASVSNDQVKSQHIREADGTSGQDTNSGAGVKTGHIQDGAVTTSKITDGAVTTLKLLNGAVTAEKLGIVCPDGQFLQYTVAGGWACSVGTPGPAGPQGLTGPQGPEGPQPHYANVIVVAKSGGDFTDPVTALDSITDASASNTYLVKIMPGVYAIEWGTAVVAKDYVDIEGSGEGVTKITCPCYGWAGGVIQFYRTTHSELRNITIESYAVGISGIHAIAVGIAEGSMPVLRKVTASAIGGETVTGVYVYGMGCAPTLHNVTVLTEAVAEWGWSWGVRIDEFNHSVTLRAVKVNSTGGSKAYGLMTGGTLGHSVVLVDCDLGGTTAGISVGGATTTRVHNSRFAGQSFAARVEPNSTLLGAGSQFSGPIEDNGTVRCVNCYDANFLSIP